MTTTPDGPWPFPTAPKTFTSDRSWIPLALLSPLLAEHTGTPLPGYRKLLAAALDGRLPATRHNGRWYVRKQDVPAAAVALGLAEPPAPDPVSA